MVLSYPFAKVGPSAKIPRVPMLGPQKWYRNQKCMLL